MLMSAFAMRFVVGYTMDTMYFSWLGNPVEVDKDNQLPQFSLDGIEKYDCSQNYTGGQIASRFAHMVWCEWNMW